MGELVSFPKRQSHGPSSAPREEVVSREAIQLWRLSLELDALVQKAILEQRCDVGEWAAVMAHRLGALLACHPDPAVLMAFCEETMRSVVERKTPPQAS